MKTTAERKRVATLDAFAAKLTDDTLKRIGNGAKLPSNLDLADLRKHLVVAYEEYLQVAGRLLPGEINREMDSLAKAARAILVAAQRRQQPHPHLVEGLRTAVRSLSPDARAALERGGWRVPSLDGCSDISDFARHANLIYGHAIVAARPIEGRQRAGGKRSAPTLTYTLSGPRQKKGRPRLTPETSLVLLLRAAYWHFTGKLPARTARTAYAGGLSGSFHRFVGEVFTLAGLTANPAESINRAGRLRRPAPPVSDYL